MSESPGGPGEHLLRVFHLAQSVRTHGAHLLPRDVAKPLAELFQGGEGSFEDFVVEGFVLGEPGREAYALAQSVHVVDLVALNCARDLHMEAVRAQIDRGEGIGAIGLGHRASWRMIETMATYVIGDIQGCFITLQRLLDRLDFERGRDHLWLVGDLVNRGPDSLSVLRWAKELEEDGGAIAVLGNHDLHLIACAEGLRSARRGDTLEAVLEAPDLDALREWLTSRPLLHREDDHVLVHAGLLPSWSLEEAERLANEAGRALRERETRIPLLEALYGKRKGVKKLRAILEAFTRVRTVSGTGELRRDFSGPPSQAPEGCRPWFELGTWKETVVFGHWAALGLHVSERLIGVDSGCVWGGSLTAVRLEDRAVFQEPSELQG